MSSSPGSTSPVLLQVGPYSIQEIAPKKFPWEQRPIFYRASNVTSWMFWGISTTVQALIIHSLDGIAPQTRFLLWFSWLAELFLCTNEFVHGMHIVCQLFRMSKTSLRSHYRLMPGPAPSIDVFVPCCGEPVEVLINTVAAAAGQDYPADKLRVVVLDDGHDQDLRKATEKLSKTLSSNGGPELLYRSRKMVGISNSHFKAGNLRYGIEETRVLGEGEFIASIDSDMIADSEWLKRMVPHFILDPKMGMLNQPQHYYNVPSRDLMAEQIEFDLWFTIFEPLNDRVGEAMCQGSGFIVRRSALDSIGNWPLANTGEDVMCSLKLLFSGWNLGYVREYLQHGQTPESLQSRLKQKARWAADHLEFIGAYGFRLTTSTLGALAWRELTAIPVTFGAVMLPLILLTQAATQEVIMVPRGQYDLLRSTMLLSFVVTKLNDFVVYGRLGLTRLSLYQSMSFWSAPYSAVSLLRPLWPGKAAPTFFVTGSFSSPIRERSKQKRVDLTQRLCSSGLPFNFGYSSICAAILVYGFFHWLNSRTIIALGTPHNVRMPFLPSSTLRLTVCMLRAFVPVLYMIYPPDVPDWKDLLEKDDMGVFRPKRRIARVMTPPGSEHETSGLRIWFDTLELITLTLFLW